MNCTTAKESPHLTRKLINAPLPLKQTDPGTETFRVNKQLLYTDHPLEGDGKHFLSKSKIAKGDLILL